MKTLTIISSMLLLLSCNKSEQTLSSQRQLVQSLGFDMSTVSVMPAPASASKPLRFRSVQEAQKFFKAIQRTGVRHGILPLTKPMAYRGQPGGPGKDDNGGVGDYDNNSSIGDYNFYGANEDTGGGGGGGANNTNSAYTVDWYMWWGYSVKFTWGINEATNTIEAANFTSSLVGFPFGVNWYHDNAAYQVSGDVISFQISGRTTYNLLIEGPTTYWIQSMVITGTYNTKTREYTISEYPERH